MSTQSRAPYPYPGGKRRWADDIWDRFGRGRNSPIVYVEPFAGSLSVLLARDEPCAREIVCDKNSLIANFWRAMQHDPEAVAAAADYPSYHDDLHARHKWLVRWTREKSGIIRNDPLYYDAQAAGWWAWGLSLWIGNDWCLTRSEEETKTEVDTDTLQPRAPDAIPHTASAAPSGRGVSVLRAKQSNVSDTMPRMSKIGGQGVMVQRSVLPMDDSVYDKRPHMYNRAGGRGVSAQRVVAPDYPGGGQRMLDVDVGNGDRLLDWFLWLQQRLARVMVINRDWTSAVTPTLLMQIVNDRPTPVAILLDPPYRTQLRTASPSYQSDVDGDGGTTAERTYDWAVQHGLQFRIAYCCHDGDFPVPEGWDGVTRGLKGIRRSDRRETNKDMIMFSPACLRAGMDFWQAGLL